MPIDMITKKLTAGTFFCLALLFCSCMGKTSKKESQGNADAEPQIDEQKTAVKLSQLDADTKGYLNGKTIAVVLGHNYNDDETVSRFTQLLALNYGIKTDTEDGLIKILVYPADFMVAGRERVSSLYNLLEDEELAGIITFGAPEGLCNALARLEDLSIRQQEERRKNTELKAEEAVEQTIKPAARRSYPVFSFFQQDDTLGSESTSDFVLDYTPPATITEAEQSAYIPNFDPATLLINSVDAMLALRGPVSADKNLRSFVQGIAGKEKTVSSYNDYETGLKSINHFIFE